VDPAAVALLAHATTIVTNALIEKKGAKAGFVATRGFRDLLELRRSSRADLYDLFQDAPRCWCRAAGASRSPSGSMRRDKS
jgi:N-methylhydantoinase A